MNSPAVVYATLSLMVLVASACTALCLAWSHPAWRRRLGRAKGEADARAVWIGELSGWPARAGSGLVSAGIAACAALAWYGVYCTAAAI